MRPRPVVAGKEAAPARVDCVETVAAPDWGDPISTFLTEEGADAPSAEANSPLESGRPRSFVGVAMLFFLRSGSVNRDMWPNRDGRTAVSLPASPSSSFLAASSTLSEISFDVPTVCRFM